MDQFDPIQLSSKQRFIKTNWANQESRYSPVIYNPASSKLAIQVFPTPKDQLSKSSKYLSTKVTQVQCKIQKTCSFLLNKPKMSNYDLNLFQYYQKANQSLEATSFNCQFYFCVTKVDTYMLLYISKMLEYWTGNVNFHTGTEMFKSQLQVQMLFPDLHL